MNKNDMDYLLYKGQISKYFPILMRHPQGVIYYISTGFNQQKFTQVFSHGYKFHGAFTRVKRPDSQDLEYMDIAGNVTERETEFGSELYNFVVAVHKNGLDIHAFDNIPPHLLQDEKFIQNAIGIYAFRHVRFHHNEARTNRKVALFEEAKQNATDYISELTTPPIENE